MPRIPPIKDHAVTIANVTECIATRTRTMLTWGLSHLDCQKHNPIRRRVNGTLGKKHWPNTRNILKKMATQLRAIPFGRQASLISLMITYRPQSELLDAPPVAMRTNTQSKYATPTW